VLAAPGSATLSVEERLVLQEIEKTGSSGIWKKHLKVVTGLSEVRVHVWAWAWTCACACACEATLLRASSRARC
jgi:hypothetical protein